MRVGVLLASGGMRCFYQLGVLEAVRDLPIRFELMVGISGGALATVTFLSDVTREMLEAVRGMAGSAKARMRPWRVLRGRSPFPHEELIDETLRGVLTEARLNRVIESPTEVRVVAAQLNGRLPYPVAGAFSMQAHALEIGPLRRLWMHPVVGRWVGFEHRVLRVDEEHTAEEVLGMLRVSSAFPPVTGRHHWEGRPLYDGAFFSSMPDFYEVEEQEALDLVWMIHTRSDQAGMFRDRPRLWHIKPSRRLRVGIWELNDELGMFQAFQVGQNDGAVLRRRLERRLEAG